jgi:hypothetical protein
MDYGTERVNSNGSNVFHVDSIKEHEDGNYLISSHHFHPIYYLSRSTGGLI